MCLLLFALDAHPDFRLVVASNRDERHARPTAPLDVWPATPTRADRDIIGGRDLEAGGSWLGIRRDGAWAAVTNVREGVNPPSAPRSRGHLVGDYLHGRQSPAAFASALATSAHHYGGFNLVLGDAHACIYYSNRGAGAPAALPPGIHALSNGGLDCDWPKTAGGAAALRRTLQPAPTPAALLALLGDDRQPPDHQLPDTGIGIELERVLGRRFIRGDDYGTRASTVILASHDRIQVWEQGFDPRGQRTELRHLAMPTAEPGDSD